MDITQTNIEEMTEPELRELIRNADEALKRRVAERARSTLKEIRQLAAEVGFEVTFAKAGKTPAAKGKVASPRGPAVQKYRNPDNPGETWAGRGRPPKWVQAAMEQGQTLEDLAIAREGAAAGG
jgi:DNA-binding protein H-NS